MPTLETKAALFAHPAKHSLSPVMHNAALKFWDIAAQYEAQDVPPENLLGAFNRLRSSALWGVNLSIPHKETALGLMDLLSKEARIMGAINTVINRAGMLEGINTDAPGFLRSLEESGVAVDGQEVVVLGAGGAARGVCWALKQAGASVAVWNRSPERARELAEEFGLDAFLSDELLPKAIAGAGGLVNTTSVGLEKPDESPIDGAWFPAGGKAGTQWVCDIVYRPLETRLLRDAQRQGIKTIDGLGMLVHQGALAFEAWTGKQAPLDVMRQAALNALKATHL